ncbi:unnamed protein product, partial [Allacma fusca]
NPITLENRVVNRSAFALYPSVELQIFTQAPSSIAASFIILFCGISKNTSIVRGPWHMYGCV